MYIVQTILGDEQAWTPIVYLKSFDMDSLQVGKAVFMKESYTTLGIEPRTYTYPERLATILVSLPPLSKKCHTWHRNAIIAQHVRAMCDQQIYI